VKMKMMKKIGFLVLFIMLAFGVQNAKAEPFYLPTSNHYQGEAFFDSGGQIGKIDFAVYDTQEYPDDWADYADLNPDMEGRYIYAYQVLTRNDSTEAVNFFTVSGIGANAIIDPGNSIGSQEDYETEGTNFEGPTSQGFNYDLTSAYWQFEEGVLVGGVHSWFLIYSSDHDYTTGTYSFDAPVSDSIVVPNPEPCTIALLGLGSIVIFTSRRKSSLAAGDMTKLS